MNEANEFAVVAGTLLPLIGALWKLTMTLMKHHTDIQDIKAKAAKAEKAAARAEARLQEQMEKNESRNAERHDGKDERFIRLEGKVDSLIALVHNLAGKVEQRNNDRKVN